MMGPVSYKVSELQALGRDNIPSELKGNEGLVYSSPATLAYNSPGAEGFGVKRAGLSVPESVMLIVAPGCCGRNTRYVTKNPEYNGRFFYLMMDETDLVTSRHLKLIPEAVKEIVEFCEVKPKVVMICMTCVDALLGTDMKRVASKCEALLDGVRVAPCYMYALTREGRRPPMVDVRQQIYSLLAPSVRKGNAINLTGFFAPVDPDCEIFDLLKGAGFADIRQIGTCSTYEEFLKMSQANLNLVLNSECRPAADDMYNRLKIPYAELTRVYGIDSIAAQYKALSNILGVEVDDKVFLEEARTRVASFIAKHKGKTVNIGECINANPFELALSLTRYGLNVGEIYATLSPEHFVYVRKLAELSPDTRIYCNLDPSMVNYSMSSVTPDLTLGKDALYYCPQVPNISWNSDVQPYGYKGLISLLDSMEEVMS